MDLPPPVVEIVAVLVQSHDERMNHRTKLLKYHGLHTVSEEK